MSCAGMNNSSGCNYQDPIWPDAMSEAATAAVKDFVSDPIPNSVLLSAGRLFVTSRSPNVFWYTICVSNTMSHAHAGQTKSRERVPAPLRTLWFSCTTAVIAVAL